MNEIEDARKIIYEAMKKDKGFRYGYQANIAMLIYDDQMAGIEGRSHKMPTNLKEVEGCNSMADRLIELIFSSDELPVQPNAHPQPLEK